PASTRRRGVGTEPWSPRSPLRAPRPARPPTAPTSRRTLRDRGGERRCAASRSRTPPRRRRRPRGARFLPEWVRVASRCLYRRFAFRATHLGHDRGAGGGSRTHTTARIGGF